MNNRHDSNGKDFEGRLGGTGKNAGSNQGDKFVKNRPSDRANNSRSPRDTGKSNRA